ncbi:MAG: endonuclease/exonuclease/phosphatase family protein [Novosphingobium sp.]
MTVLAAARLGGLDPVLDLASLAVPPAAVVSALCAIRLLARTRSATGKLICGLCLVPGVVVWEPGLNPASCRPSLRVAWINAHNPATARPIADWIEREAPQIVGVAEVDRNALALRAYLARRYPYRQSCLVNDHCSTLLYAARRPRDAQGLARGDPENRKALSAVRMTFAGRTPASAVTVLAVHLSRPFPLRRQRRELAELETALSLSGDTIVMGDFNMPPRMQALRAFAARNGLRVVPAGGPTWPTRLGGVKIGGLWQIDQLLLGPGWRVAGVRRSPDLGSDHRGYVADLCRVAENGAGTGSDPE